MIERTRLITTASALVVLISGSSAIAQDDNSNFKWETDNSSIIMSVNSSQCVTFGPDRYLELCDDKTIWMSLDMKPQEVAKRFIEDLESIGFRLKEDKP